jgi:hypothetical protein
MVIPGLEKELRHLPALADRLPLPIPRPTYLGRRDLRGPKDP